MDVTDIAKKLGLSESKHVIRKAAELRRLCDIQFDSSVIGVGEICKAVICLEIAATRFEVVFNRQNAIKLSGMSEKAYNRSFNAMQNGLGVKNKLDIRELAIQFGCVRLIPFVHRGLSQYKEQFLKSLPASRRASADFTRPVFTAVAFYLCAKKHKLKVDKIKLIELCGTSESEFSSVSTSMKDLCYAVFGISKEKKDPRDVKGNRDLLDALPEKRKFEDGGYLSDDGKEKEQKEEMREQKTKIDELLESNKQLEMMTASIMEYLRTKGMDTLYILRVQGAHEQLAVLIGCSKVFVWILPFVMMSSVNFLFLFHGNGQYISFANISIWTINGSLDSCVALLVYGNI